MLQVFTVTERDSMMQRHHEWLKTQLARESLRAEAAVSGLQQVQEEKLMLQQENLQLMDKVKHLEVSCLLC